MDSFNQQSEKEYLYIKINFSGNIEHNSCHFCNSLGRVEADSQRLRFSFYLDALKTEILSEMRRWFISSIYTFVACD